MMSKGVLHGASSHFGASPRLTLHRSTCAPVNCSSKQTVPTRSIRGQSCQLAAYRAVGTQLLTRKPVRHIGARKSHIAAQAAAEAAADNPDKKELPNLFYRVAAAFFYCLPWIDIYHVGEAVHNMLPFTMIFKYIIEPLIPLYYSSQFAPLIIFFLLFLAIVRNSKLPHFLRFHCMQAIMIDIACMLVHILKQYFPAELRWSAVMGQFLKYGYMTVMVIVLYCMFFALKGMYADIPAVSESVYIQVEASEYS